MPASTSSTTRSGRSTVTEYRTVEMPMTPEVEKVSVELMKKSMELIAEKAEELGLDHAAVMPVDVFTVALRQACIEIVALRAEKRMTRG